jgi:hypothetical protein
MDFLKKLETRFRPLLETQEQSSYQGDASFKDPSAPGYDRQNAEDALYHTVGPLTDNPTWDTARWTSSSTPPEGYAPGGPAPQWTQTEVIVAMAGDPNYMYAGKRSAGPTSPMYGHMGGAPLYRVAKQTAKTFGKDKDRDFVAELYSNGLLGLTRVMQAGYDKSQGPFIKFAMPRIKGFIRHGGGKTKAQERAERIAKRLLEMGPVLGDQADAASIEEISNKITGKFRTESLHDIDSGNPYGPFSPDLYSITSDMAKAVREEDEGMLEDVKRRLQDLIEKMEDDVNVLGASTGVGQAISTKDRATSIGIASMDQPKSSGDDATKLAGTLADKGAPKVGDLVVSKEAVDFVLEMSLKDDLNQTIKGSATLQDIVTRVATRGGYSAQDVEKAMRPLAGTGYRYVLRQLGKIAKPYVGEGILRANTETPREKPGWWKAGEDPEIERKPDGSLWESEWRRTGRPVMTSREIADEMAREVVELTQLGIPTGRAANLKMVDGKPMVMSPQSIDMTIRPIRARLALLAAIYEQSDIDYFGESTMDAVDRQIIAETLCFINEHLIGVENRGIIQEMCQKVRAICG